MASPIWSQACLDARHTDTLIALMGSAIRVLRPGGIPALCRAASGAA
jgi:hypothetical protein